MAVEHYAACPLAADVDEPDNPLLFCECLTVRRARRDLADQIWHAVHAHRQDYWYGNPDAQNALDDALTMIKEIGDE